MSNSAIPFSTVGIDHVVFLIDDMPKALKFYEEVLGARVGYSYPTLGMEQVWCGAALIVLWDITHEGAKSAVPPVIGGRNVDHICIATTSFDHQAMRDHLKSHNVEIEREATHGGARGMGHSVYIRDPFGNKLELKGPAEYPDGKDW